MLKVELFNQKYKEKWDKFVKESKNGTIFHTRQFLSYHPPDRFRDHSLLFVKDGHILSVLPACVIEEDNSICLYSHKWSTYGGFVVPKNCGIKLSLELVDSLLEYVDKKNIKKIWIRVPEYIFEKEPAQEIKFAMWYRGFKIKYLELSTCYDLEIFNNKDLRSPIFWEARKSIREGIEIIFDDLKFYKEFYDLLSKNLLKKYNKKPTHTFEEILKLKKLLGEQMTIITAHYKKKLIGGLLVFLAHDKTAHIFYSVGKGNIKGIYPTDTLVDFLVRYLKLKGFKYLNYGISTENEGKIINLDLFRFKEKFKGFGVYREVWEWTK